MPQPPTSVPDTIAAAIDHDDRLERFGADPLTDAQIDRFPAPVHHLVRRRVYFAGRDVDRFLGAIERGDRASVVTGVGPSGPLHAGHCIPLYFARYLQERAGVHVVVPLSDDEKAATRDLSIDEVGAHARDNLRDVLAVGFDPDLTTVVVDTLDADVVYPQAVRFARDVTPATYEAVYGEARNVGESFYPAVQAVHLLLTQLLDGPHPTLVPIAADQDPHVRLARDVAAKERYAVEKPAALLAGFLPRLDGGPGKMSSSADAPRIELTADPETVRETIMTHAYSGGRSSVEAHRRRGGDPTVDAAFALLAYCFEPDDETLADLAERYREGDLLSGELKGIAAERTSEFLAAHQRRRADLGPLPDALAPFRLTDDERERLSLYGLED